MGKEPEENVVHIGRKEPVDETAGGVQGTEERVEKPKEKSKRRQGRGSSMPPTTGAATVPKKPWYRWAWLWLLIPLGSGAVLTIYSIYFNEVFATMGSVIAQFPWTWQVPYSAQESTAVGQLFVMGILIAAGLLTTGAMGIVEVKNRLREIGMGLNGKFFYENVGRIPAVEAVQREQEHNASKNNSSNNGKKKKKKDKVNIANAPTGGNGHVSGLTLPELHELIVAKEERARQAQDVARQEKSELDQLGKQWVTEARNSKTMQKYLGGSSAIPSKSRSRSHPQTKQVARSPPTAPEKNRKTKNSSHKPGSRPETKSETNHASIFASISADDEPIT